LSRAPRSALPSMAMTSPSPMPSKARQGRDPGQHPTEGRIQRLRIDHPELGRIGVMRRYRLPELQEAPENMLFCSPEGRHPGVVGCAAEHGDKAHDKQFTKVVTRVVGPEIGDVVEGGEKDVHAGIGLQKGDPDPRIHLRQNSNAPQPALFMEIGGIGYVRLKVL